MVVLKTKIVIDGKTIEVPVFETKIKPGKEVTEDIVDLLQREEEIENKIQEIVKKIRSIVLKYGRIKRNLDYSFEVGSLLQFVDKKGYENVKGRIWQRIAHDLEPDLLFGKKKTIKKKSSPEKESKRNIEDMYQLAKFPKKYLHRVSWGQWDEILKFKEIYKNKRLLGLIMKECKRGLSGIALRNKIKSLREKLKSENGYKRT